MKQETLLSKAGGPAVIRTALGITAETIRKWRRAGAIPTKRMAWFCVATGKTPGTIAHLFGTQGSPPR